MKITTEELFSKQFDENSMTVIHISTIFQLYPIRSTMKEIGVTSPLVDVILTRRQTLLRQVHLMLYNTILFKKNLNKVLKVFETKYHSISENI